MAAPHARHPGPQGGDLTPLDETLQVKCKGCYQVFEVPNQMSRAEFQSASLPTEYIQCPHCRIRRPYDMGDYFFGD